MAHARTRITTTKFTPGTPEYMSPEQARGDEHLDHRTDLYSAGVVLYELLTGRPPFRADSETAVIHRILHEDPADPRTINKDANPHLATLALRLMAKRPEDRFASATEAIKALEAGERVRSPEKRRRLRRVVLTALIASGLIAGAGWLTQRLVAGRGEISEVRIDPDTRLSIQARYGDDPKWRQFYTFAPEAQEVSAVVRVDLDGNGHLAVVAGVNRALAGHCLFAFDCGGNGIWRLNMSSNREWPDCGSPTQWRCADLATANLDGRPGDELVVAAGDYAEYPSRVSTIDPRTGEVRATFWHMGRIDSILVQPDFFGARPAIIAVGMNNKLDGFDAPEPDDPENLTHWGFVSAVMILDPGNMEGLGPPRTARMGRIPSAKVHAYAFLDRPPVLSVGYIPEGSTRLRNPKEEEIARIGMIQPALYEVDQNDNTGPWFTVDVWQPLPGRSTRFTVDRNLNLKSGTVISGMGLKRSDPDAYWHQYWHRVIQNGEYVKE